MSYQRTILYTFASFFLFAFLSTLSCDGGDDPDMTELNKFSVTGSVFKSGTTEGISGIQVRAEPADAGATTTNSDGGYVLTGLVQGQTYTIKFNPGQANVNYTENEFRVVEINADRENGDITLMSTKGDVVGIVTNSLNNEPLEAVRVTISPGNESRNTGTDGIYTFDNLQEREYTIQFVRSGFESDTKTITTVAANIQNGDIALTPIAPIQVDPSQIDFGTSLSSEVIRITNETSEALNYEIQAPANWIKPEKVQGIISGLNSELIRIDVDRRPLGVGEFSGQIAVNIPGRGSRTVEVLLEKLDASAAVLKLLSEGTLNFGSTIEGREIGVWNEGDNTLEWGLTVSENWLSATKSDGSLPPNNTEYFSIQVDRTGLADGTYNGTVNFTSNGGSGSISVLMEVKSDNSGSGEMVVTSGLRAYYTFDDGTVKDEQGNFQAVAIGPSTSSDTPTGNGLAMVFDGTGDYIQVSGNPIRNTNTSTIHATLTFWIKSTLGGAVFAIPQLADDASNEFVVGTRSDKLRHSLWSRENRCCSSTVAGVFNVDIGNLILDERWHMVALIYDGATKLTSFYFDGVKIQEEGYVLYARIDAELSRIGIDYYNGSRDASGISDFNGSLDNIRFYSRPLSASEVKEIFDARQ